MFSPVLAPLNRCSPLTLAALLFVGALVAFSWRLGAGPIHRTMEGREALVMQEIARTGNWILPLRNGETIPSKPPLLHWAGMTVARLTGGVSEWSVRFPCALFSALSVGLTCLLGCRLAGREVGLLAGLLLLTTPGFAEMAREGWVDPVLSFFVLAALASFSSMYENEHWRGWQSVAFYLSLAGAVLSKGPIGYLLPALVILAYLVVQQQLTRLRDLLSLPGVVLALGLPLTWYLLALKQGGWAFVHRQVLQENLLRFTAGSGKRIPSGAFFLLPFLRDGFPWSVLFCLGLWNFSRHAPLDVRFVCRPPVAGVWRVVVSCVGGVWVVYAGTAGRWHAALWVALACLLLATLGISPFTRTYSKEFKAFTGFAAAIRQTVGLDDPLFFYTPAPYSAESDEFSQVYFYLNRRVPLAPCAAQADLGRCLPGYYLLRLSHLK